MTPSEWSKAVKDRDGKCVDCGTTELLHAHHIKPKSQFPELRFDLANGATVCPTCHARRHADEGKPKGNLRQPRRKTLSKQVSYWMARAEDAESKILAVARAKHAGELVAPIFICSS